MLRPMSVQGWGGGAGSDGDSLVLRAGTDGHAAWGHSHLAGKGAEDKSRALRHQFDLWPSGFHSCSPVNVLITC